MFEINFSFLSIFDKIDILRVIYRILLDLKIDNLWVLPQTSVILRAKISLFSKYAKAWAHLLKSDIFALRMTLVWGKNSLFKVLFYSTLAAYFMANSHKLWQNVINMLKKCKANTFCDAHIGCTFKISSKSERQTQFELN